MDELELLKKEADELGITYSSRIGITALTEKIKKAKSMSEETSASTEVVKAKEVITPEVLGGGSIVMTAKEYGDYSKKKGTIFGRKEGEKTMLSLEELRVLINSNWTRAMVMEKHGITAEELNNAVINLQNLERRERAINWK